MSSVFNEISEVQEYIKDNKSNTSSKVENKVGVPRRSTVIIDSKLWSIEDDVILRNVIEKNQKSGQVVNWAKVAKEFNNIMTKNFYTRTGEECRARFHNINNKHHSELWTELELDECIKLHKKYGKNWKLISKKMPTKSDKQIMYKINSLQQGPRQPENKEFPYETSVLRDKMLNQRSEDEERNYEKIPSKELYRHMMSRDQHEGSSSYSRSSEQPFSFRVGATSDNKDLGVIKEEDLGFDAASFSEFEF
mmetsp:Transcript_4460/g.5387  ORF Transcript_4460/g.5387 Transcript_4460/m.5387 type:complete len:250 (-) Transcript_4460:54-803(-)